MKLIEKVEYCTYKVNGQVYGDACLFIRDSSKTYEPVWEYTCEFYDLVFRSLYELLKELCESGEYSISPRYNVTKLSKEAYDQRYTTTDGEMEAYLFGLPSNLV